MDVKFKEEVKTNIQESIARYLRSHKYYFESINDYDHNHFYCMIKCEIIPLLDPFESIKKKIGIKKKPKYDYYALSMTTCQSCTGEDPFPFVFTREDVLDILADIPENYEPIKVGAEL